MRIENIGDDDANFWEIYDDAGTLLSYGRDKSKAIREAIEKANKELEREQYSHFGSDKRM